MENKYLRLICDYEDFAIYIHTLTGLLYCYNKETEEIKEVLEVYRIPDWDEISTDEKIDDVDIISMCTDDYDYSGELDDMSEYCFWKEVEQIDLEEEN